MASRKIPAQPNRSPSAKGNPRAHSTATGAAADAQLGAQSRDLRLALFRPMVRRYARWTEMYWQRTFIRYVVAG